MPEARTALPQMTGFLAQQPQPQAPRAVPAALAVLSPWSTGAVRGSRAQTVLRASAHLNCNTGPGEPCLCPRPWRLGSGWAISKVERDPYLRPSGHTGGSTLGDSTSSLRDTGCLADTDQAPGGGRARHPVGSPQTSL